MNELHYISGMLFASGLAATTTLCHLLKEGDHMIAMNDLYGGKLALLLPPYFSSCYKDQCDPKTNHFMSSVCLIFRILYDIHSSILYFLPMFRKQAATIFLCKHTTIQTQIQCMSVHWSPWKSSYVSVHMHIKVSTASTNIVLIFLLSATMHWHTL